MEEKDIVLIDRYLQGELTEKKVTLVEKRLEKDPEFKALFEDIAAIQSGIAYSARRKTLEIIEKEEKKIVSALNRGNKEISIKRKRIIIGIAASVAIVVALSLVLFNESKTPHELYTEQYSVYPNIMYPIHRDVPDSLTLEEKAFHAYERGEYDKAIELFLSGEIKQSPELTFYIGNTYMAMEKEEKAIDYFIQLTGSEGHAYKAQALWYLGLAYIKLESMENARKTLYELSSGTSSYAPKAKEVLKYI